MGAGRGVGGGHDVRYYIVDTDGFALGKGAEGDLDLGHTVGIGVVFGVFAEFLGDLRWFCDIVTWEVEDLR